MPTESTLDLKNVFGVNVERQFRDWFDTKYLPDFRKRYGKDRDITALLLDPRLGWFERLQAWDNVSQLSHILVHTDSSAAGILAATAPGGTLENVERKLRPCLRYLCPSLDMELRLESLRVGDFPWEGADDEGGVSGLKKEEDALELEVLEAKLRKLLKKVGKAAKAKADSLKGLPVHSHGGKYMIGIDVSEQFPGYAVAISPTTTEYTGDTED